MYVPLNKSNSTTLSTKEATEYIKWRLEQKSESFRKYRPEDIQEFVELLNWDQRKIDSALMKLYELKTTLGKFVTSYKSRLENNTQETLLDPINDKDYNWFAEWKKEKNK